ncbi:hypothetical protein Emin_0382 [Elusimicrobium minutum Pei191]|uniref:Uncharacterized protein n=1 Tax=Elusimicrobium minutum (strain Pei191) TaxID=445932 RepID=B2KBB7_ELUMP|nr:hypothetical protein [Elusimicrobium minutum]ACC97939.1 hypothetical protein Emin_0382 [Elusimicrobium minutum Pei191]
MKKILVLFLVSFLFAACNGTTPPQWWDPSGKYTDEGAAKPQSQNEQKKAVSNQQVKKTTPAPAVQPPRVDPAETFTPIEQVEVEIINLPMPSVLDE